MRKHLKTNDYIKFKSEKKVSKILNLPKEKINKFCSNVYQIKNILKCSGRYAECADCPGLLSLNNDEEIQEIFGKVQYHCFKYGSEYLYDEYKAKNRKKENNINILDIII